MTDDDLTAIERAWITDHIGTHWHTCHIDGDPRWHAGCCVARLVAEVRRLRAELAEQKRTNLQLAERLAACSQVLGKAAERGKVCVCNLDNKPTA